MISTSFLKMINRTTRVAAFSFLASLGSALATELPRFDGVYFQNISGDYIELQPIDFEIFNVCGQQGQVGSLNIADASQIANAPSLSSGRIESIFIRSREERLQHVSYAVPVNTFLGSLKDSGGAVLTRSHQVLGPCEQSGIFTREIIPIDWDDSSIADARCGWAANEFRLLSEFDNTAEYFSRETANLGSRRSPAIGECGKSNSVRSAGIFIRTNQNIYFVGYR